MRTNLRGYRADLKNILKKPQPNLFYIIENLEVTMQFVSDAIIDSYETNCPSRPKNASIKVPW